MAIDDSSVYGYFALGIIHLYKKQYEKALVDVEKMIALTPENADNYALMAAIFLSAGRTEKATEMIEKAMQLNPAAPAWYLNLLGSTYAAAGHQAEAVATHKSVLDRDPNHSDAFRAHLDLTILYVGLGKQEDARAEAEEILKLVPHFSVKVWGQRNPNKDRSKIEHGMAALRKAGLT